MKTNSVKYVMFRSFIDSSLKDIHPATQFEISEELLEYFRLDTFDSDVARLVLISPRDLITATKRVSVSLSKRELEYASEIALAFVEDLKSLDQSVMIAVET